MASIALAQAGLLIPVPGLNLAAGIAGAAIGAYLDSKWLAPLLADKPEPLDVSGLQGATSDEGSPVPFCLGPRCRVEGGSIVWLSEIESETDTEPSKGSLTAPATGPVVSYYRSVAIAFHHDPRIRIEAVERVIAEGKTIYRGPEAVSVSSNLLFVEVLTLRDFDDASASNVVREVWMELVSPNGGPDLQALESGVDATISGFSNAANNGTFRCIGVDVDTATGIQRARLRNSSAVAESASGGVKSISQDLPETPRRWFDAIRIYNGSAEQMPDPLIEEAEDGPVPAFRGTAYVVIERLRITEWGGRLPRLTFLVRESSQRTVISALGTLLQRAGVPYTDFDLSALDPTQQFVGMVLPGPRKGIETIAPLLVAYDISAREEGGKIVFFPRASAPLAELEEGEMGAVEDPNDRSEPYTEADSDGEGADLPRELQLSFADSANNMQQGMQRAFFPGAGGEALESVSVPVSMSAQQAARRAHELLWGRVANLRTLRTTIPPSRIDIGPGHVFDFAGERWLIARHSLRDNGIAEIEAVREWSDTDWSHVPAQGAPEDEVTQENPADHALAIVDAAPMRDQDWFSGQNGHYWGHAVGDTSVNEPRGRYVSGFVATTPTAAGSGKVIGVECTMGWTETALAAAPFEYLDRINSLDVRLLNGELESKTREQVSRGENWAQIGREIVGFETATLIGTRRYRLSNLHRGLRGTNGKVGTHAIGEPFVLLEADKLQLFTGPASLGFSDGNPYFRGASAQGLPAFFAATPAEFRTGAKRPMHPYPVRAVRDLVAATFRLEWVRRVPLNGSQIGNPYRSSATYRIELASTVGGATRLVLTTTIGSNQASEQSWTSAQLTAAGLTYSSPIAVRIWETRNGVRSEPYEVLL